MGQVSGGKLHLQLKKLEYKEIIVLDTGEYVCKWVILANIAVINDSSGGGFGRIRFGEEGDGRVVGRVHIAEQFIDSELFAVLWGTAEGR